MSEISGTHSESVEALTEHLVVDAASIARIEPCGANSCRIVAGGLVGWSISKSGIKEIVALCQGRVIATAWVGISRPDIGQLFPSIAESDSAGFSLSLIGVELPLVDEFELTLVARSDSGIVAEDVFLLPMPVEGRPVNSQFAAIPPMRLMVEQADLGSNGYLRIGGWCASFSEILAVQAFVDDKHIGSCDIGISRRDIGTEYSFYPNAARCGFIATFLIPESLTATATRVRVEALTVDGAIKSQLRPIHTNDTAIPPLSPAAYRFAVPVGLPHTAHDVNRDTSQITDSTPPAEESPIRFNCDEIIFVKDGLVRVSGWALSTGVPIASIEIYYQQDQIGEATQGLTRTDVGRSYSKIEGSINSGFEFQGTVQSGFANETEYLEIVIRLENGFEERMTVLADVTTEQSIVDSGQSIRLNIDSPKIGEAPVELTRGFTISGWAVARDSIDRVEIDMNGQVIGVAYFGTRREDISAAFEGWPNALLSGYAFSVPSRLLKEGNHSFTVRAFDKNGVLCETSFDAIAQLQDQAAPNELPREKISYAEIMASAAVISAAAIEANFNVFLQLRTTRNAIKQLAMTLRDLERQAWGRWQVELVLPPKSNSSQLLKGLSLHLRPETMERIGVLGADFGRNDWIAVLQAGDRLACDAFLALGLAVVDGPSADFVYFDDRRLDASGRPATYFKPDWSPELLLSQNYIGRSFFVRGEHLAGQTSSVAKLIQMGDYHLALLLTEKATDIRHIPKVLIDESKNSRASVDEERKALREALKRRMIAARVQASFGPGLHRVSRKVTIPGKVSIIMPSIGARDLIKISIESIRERTSYRDYEIIVLDNIRGETLTEAQLTWKEWFRKHADVVVEVNEKFNWSRLNNIGAANSSGSYLLFLNDDIEVLDPDWLQLLISEAERKEVGAVGPQLLYPDGKVQHAGIFFAHGSMGGGRHAFRFAESDDPGYFGLALSQRNVSSVTGACLMSRRDVYDAVNGFNEAHDVVNNDVDYCLRVWRAGYQVVYTPHTRLVHHELASRAEMKDDFDRSGFIAEWRDFIEKGDPFYNINLSSSSDDFLVDDEPIRTVYAGYPLGDIEQIRNILVVKLDHLGDVVTALPAIRRLKARFPTARITALVAKSSVGIAQLEPAIDEILEFQFFDARSSKGYKEITETDYENLRKMLHEKSFDLALDLRKPGDTRHILKYSGARILAGIDSNWQFDWLDFADEWEQDPLQKGKRAHVGADFVNFVDGLANSFEVDRRGVIISPDHPLPPLTDGLRCEFSALFDRPYVSMQPASGNALRQWPPEHFASLINLLVERCDVNVAIIGGPDERDVADAVLLHVTPSDRVFDLVGRSKVSELASLLNQSSLFVGNNSGPHHLAAALGVPTVGVHSGVVTSEEWGPLGPFALAIRRDTSCAPCYRGNLGDCHRNIECVRALLPYEVFRQCSRFLKIGTSIKLKHQTA